MCLRSALVWLVQKLSGQSPKAPKEEPASGPSWFNFGGSQAPVRHPRKPPSPA